MAPKCRKRSAGADGCAKIERTILHHCLKLCFVTQPRCQAFPSCRILCVVNALCVGTAGAAQKGDPASRCGVILLAVDRRGGQESNECTQAGRSR